MTVSMDEKASSEAAGKNPDRNRIIDNYETLLLGNSQLIQFLKETKELKVVSIGCGNAPIELVALQRVIRKPFTFYGIDTDNDAINKCKKEYARDKNCIFEVVDGADQEAVKKLLANKKAHLVIFRHPVLNKLQPEVYAAFSWMYTKTIPEILAQGGYVVTSNYLETEIPTTEILLQAISQGQVKAVQREGVFALTEKTYTRSGYTDLSLQAVDLLAETNFVVAQYTPALILTLEDEKATGTSSEGTLVKAKLKQLFAEATTQGKIMSRVSHREEEKTYKYGHDDLVGNFFQLFLETLVKHPDLKKEEFMVALDEIVNKVLQKASGKERPAQIKYLTDSYFYAGADVEGNPFFALDVDNPKQMTILDSVAEGMLKVAKSPAFKQMDEENRTKHLLQTVQLFGIRPLPEQVPVQKDLAAMSFLERRSFDR